jgi:hypothetical protein
VLLTLLGAAGESLGYDRMLKTNTAKHRVHSLFRQGCMLYDLIPMMPQARLRPLMQRFSLGPVDKPSPNADASKQDESEEAGGKLVVPGGDAPLLLELTDEALNP